MTQSWRSHVMLFGSAGWSTATDTGSFSLVQARLLTCLALRPKSSWSVEELVERVWCEETRPTARNALANQVSKVRSRIGPEAIDSSDGYRLGDADVDVLQFEEHLERAIALLADGDVLDAGRAAREACSLSARGAPLVAAGDLNWVRIPAASLQRRVDNARHLTVIAGLTNGAPWPVGMEPDDPNEIEVALAAAERCASGAVRTATRLLHEFASAEYSQAGLEASATFKRLEALVVAGESPRSSHEFVSVLCVLAGLPSPQVEATPMPDLSLSRLSGVLRSGSSTAVLLDLSDQPPDDLAALVTKGVLELSEDGSWMAASPVPLKDAELDDLAPVLAEPLHSSVERHPHPWADLEPALDVVRRTQPNRAIEIATAAVRCSLSSRLGSFGAASSDDALAWSRRLIGVAARARLGFEVAVAEWDLRTGGGSLDDLERLLLEAMRLGESQIACDAAVVCARFGPALRLGEPDHQATALIELCLGSVGLDPANRARLLAARATLQHGSPDHGGGADDFANALNLARRLGDPRVEGAVLEATFLVQTGRGVVEERRQHGLRLRELGYQLRDRHLLLESDRVLFNVGVEVGDAELMGASREHLRSLVERDGSAKGHRFQHSVDFLHFVLHGDLERAEVARDECHRYGTAAGLPGSRLMIVYFAQTACLALESGELAELLPVLTDKREYAASVPAWNCVTAFASVEAGDGQRAAEYLGYVADDLDALTSPTIYSIFGMTAALTAAARHGDEALTRAILPFLEPWTGRMSNIGVSTFGPVGLAVAEAHGSLGDDVAALRALDCVAAYGQRSGLSTVSERAEAVRATLLAGEG